MRNVLGFLLLSWCLIGVVSICPECSYRGDCIRGLHGDVYCQCYDDNYRGHFTGNACQVCLPGYRSPDCLEEEVYISDFVWLMMTVIVFGLMGCLALICLKIACCISSFIADSNITEGNQEGIEDIEEGPILDEGDLSAEEEHKAQILNQRNLMAELVGEHLQETPCYEDDAGDNCKICFERSIDCVFLECGHTCSCFECGKQLTSCPFCRKPIVRVKKTFRM
eukprot:NODE_6809_length_840_cov_42.556485_g6211_i0.p1 GENE.NODE_6809_length_840_cov_42.556485_g6211_i0~~NODE_6809_length_840_cov_42.556485_g6211_i0.p1  ORF type:complete len:223 (+),score=17.22 NODE_6809_length_840_cov_42.556485_g6211_i0:56-724(+)